MAVLLNAVALCVALLVCAGCGEDERAAAPGGSPTTTPGAPSAPTAPPAPSVAPAPRDVAIRLQLTVWEEEGQPPAGEATLTCPRRGRASATGYLRGDAAAACAAARRATATLSRSVPGDRVCTEIYGGPQQATVRGRIGDRRIDRDFDRTDGCRIAEWDAAAPLLNPALPRGGPGAEPPPLSG